MYIAIVCNHKKEFTPFCSDNAIPFEYRCCCFFGCCSVLSSQSAHNGRDDEARGINKASTCYFTLSSDDWRILERCKANGRLPKKSISVQKQTSPGRYVSFNNSGKRSREEKKSNTIELWLSLFFASSSVPIKWQLNKNARRIDGVRSTFFVRLLAPCLDGVQKKKHGIWIAGSAKHKSNA